MSIKVEIPELADVVAQHGAGYLLTGSDNGRPHAAQLEFGVSGAELRCVTGRTSVRNATARPAVSILWPPTEPGGYSLIVDGDAQVVDADTGAVVVTATSAVLHRPAPANPGAEGDCASDCAPVSIGGEE